MGVDVGVDAICDRAVLVGGMIAVGSGASVATGVGISVGVGAIVAVGSTPLAHPAKAAKVKMPARASAISLGRFMESPLWSPSMGRPVW